MFSLHFVYLYMPFTRRADRASGHTQVVPSESTYDSFDMPNVLFFYHGSHYIVTSFWLCLTLVYGTTIVRIRLTETTEFSL
jgi:hypothetical protein